MLLVTAVFRGGASEMSRFSLPATVIGTTCFCFALTVALPALSPDKAEISHVVS